MEYFYRQHPFGRVTDGRTRKIYDLGPLLPVLRAYRRLFKIRRRMTKEYKNLVGENDKEIERILERGFNIEEDGTSHGGQEYFHLRPDLCGGPGTIFEGRKSQ